MERVLSRDWTHEAIGVKRRKQENLHWLMHNSRLDIRNPEIENFEIPTAPSLQTRPNNKALYILSSAEAVPV